MQQKVTIAIDTAPKYKMDLKKLARTLAFTALISVTVNLNFEAEKSSFMKKINFWNKEQTFNILLE